MDKRVSLRSLGLLGGTTWHSTLDYYRLINQGVSDRIGGLTSAPLWMRSVEFSTYAGWAREGKYKELSDNILQSATTLRDIGAEGLLLCANTLHVFADDRLDELGMRWLHIADASLEALRKRGSTTPLLLGTSFTMKSDFYDLRLAKHNIGLVRPDESQWPLLDQYIFGELAEGNVTPGAIAKVTGIIETCLGQGADSVLLACTEFPLLFKDDDFGLPLINTLEEHAAAAVRFCAG